jgi:hypothetical protein
MYLGSTELDSDSIPTSCAIGCWTPIADPSVPHGEVPALTLAALCVNEGDTALAMVCCLSWVAITPVLA